MPRNNMSSLVLLCCVLATSVQWFAFVSHAQTTNLDTYFPIDWTQVPDTQPASIVVADTDIGPCICDLTWEACDVNCFCDAECTATELDQFSLALAEGPAAYTVQQCVDSNLVEMNSRGGIASNVIDNLLCVTTDNNPSQGFFYDSPESISSSAFETLSNDALYKFYTETTPRSYKTSAYVAGDVIRTARTDNANGTSFHLTNQGKMRFPGPGFGSYCSDQNYPEYLYEVDRSCYRPPAPIADVCTGTDTSVWAQAYVEDWVGRFREASPEIDGDYIPIHLTSLVYESANGAETPIAAGANDTAVITTGGKTLYALDTSDIPAPAVNGSDACGCVNTVRDVSYTMIHELDGTLVQVHASIVLVSLQGTTNPTTLVCELPAFVQNFAVHYNSTASGTNPDQIRAKSGSPGYQTGQPVLAGLLTAEPNGTAGLEAVAQYRKGLQVLGPDSDGHCSLTSAGSSTVVKFGENAVVGCTIPLTQQELITHCATTGPVPYLALDTDLLVGQWGSSDHHNQWQWKGLVTKVEALAATWVSSRRTCESMIDGVHVEVAWTNYGSEDNPQAGILEVRQHFTTSNWHFSPSDATDTDYFPVTATVTFLEYRQISTNEFVPTGPPVLPKFPQDTLYPLYIESAAPPARALSHWVQLACMTGVMLAVGAFM